MLIDVFTGWSGPCLAVESHLRRMRNSFVEAPNCLYLGPDHLSSFRFSSALAHNSMDEILSFYLPFNQYSATKIHINKLSSVLSLVEIFAKGQTFCRAVVCQCAGTTERNPMVLTLVRACCDEIDELAAFKQ